MPHTTTIRYNVTGASKSGVTLHPQEDAKRLGMKVLAFEGVPIADCVFMEVENLPEQLPPYIEVSDFKIENA